MVVRRGAGGTGFVLETFETHGGVTMATVVGCGDADQASRVIRATLQDYEREADAAAAAARGLVKEPA